MIDSNKRSLDNTTKTKIYSGFGKSCFALGGAIAGFPIAGVIGMGFGAFLGFFFGGILEKSIKKTPSQK